MAVAGLYVATGGAPPSGAAVGGVVVGGVVVDIGALSSPVGAGAVVGAPVTGAASGTGGADVSVLTPPGG